MAKKEEKPNKFEKNEKTDSINMDEVEENGPKTFSDLQEEADLADAKNPEISKYLDELIRQKLIDIKREKQKKKEKEKKEEVKEKKKPEFWSSFDSDSTSDSRKVFNYNEWREQEIKEKRLKKKKIEKLLEQHTPVDFVSTRKGNAGLKFVYLEGQTAIQLANAVFGSLGWKSEITSVDNVFMEKVNGDFLACTTAAVRVTVLGYDASHEEIGIGKGQGKDKVAALTLAQKSAVTGALKRALREFGNLLGNSLYDVFHINNLDTNHANFPDRITYDLLMEKYFKDVFQEDNDVTLKTDDDERKEKAPKNPNGRELEDKTENKPMKKETKPQDRESPRPERKENEEVDGNEDEINDDDIAQFWPWDEEALPEEFKKK